VYEPIEGECMKVVDNTRKDNEIVCGAPAVVEVLVRNDFALFVVTLCETHRVEHKDFYRNRNRRSRPRRHT
jgi:hypothetical protein